MKTEFKINIIYINDCKVIRLPDTVSQLLPSRGMNMATISSGNIQEIVALEPDGLSGHWFKADQFNVEEDLTISLEVLNEWIDPVYDLDLLQVLESDDFKLIWTKITTKAKWEWVRWIQSTANTKTRDKRITTMKSMLLAGKKRPCCFNSNQCTIQEVSSKGMLLV